MKNDPTTNQAANCPSDGSRCLCKKSRLTHLGLLVLVFGLLLWARFLLVTGHPRTALADPAESHGLAVPASATATAAHP